MSASESVAVLGAGGGNLTILASGPQEVRQRCGPIFDAIAQKVIWLGEAGTGTRMELVINAWLLSLVEGLAETILSPRGSTSIHPRSSRRSRLGRSTIPTPS